MRQNEREHKQCFWYSGVKLNLKSVQTASNSKRQVLVVDDESAVANVMEMMLRFEGYEVQTVPGGREALAALEQTGFDFIITDYAMPLMKGDELAAIIKQRWPRKPVIMLTAHAEMLKNSGRKITDIDALINKPFLLDDLRAAMARSLSAV
jgi:CheY-like chemotaxis protein